MKTNNLATRELIFALLGSCCIFFPLHSQAQMPSNYPGSENQINNPNFNNSFNSNFSQPNTGGNSYGSLEYNPLANFWNNIKTPNKNQIPENTILTGVLQEDISSKKSKPGDVFSIMLPENYTIDDRIMVPQYSKFVGTVVSVCPAKQARYGSPGTLQISIQSLVAPDGTSVPVTASIEYNPNQAPKLDTKKSSFIPVGQFGKTLAYSVLYLGGSTTGRMGFPFLLGRTGTGGGKDFSLSQGELIPLKLTQPVDVTPFLPAINNAAKNQIQTTTQNPPATNPNEMPPVAPQAAPNAMNSGQNNTQNSPAYTDSNMMPGANNPAGPEPF